MFLCISLTALTAAAATDVFVGATVHPVTSPPIQDAVLVVDDGKITALGPRDKVPIPETAAVHDVAHLHIIPGLIDLHSHIGGGRLHEALDNVMPAISAIDAIDPTHPSIDRARAGGITTVNVMPGSGKLMGGQTAYLSLRRSAVVDEMLRCDGPALGVEAEAPTRRAQICGGVKMAAGTNPQGDGGDPKSRMGSAFLQRKALRKGQTRLKEWPETSPDKRNRASSPKPDPAADALADIVAGKRTVHLHAHRADDIVTALTLREEFELDLIIQHGSEGFKIAELLAEARVPVAINVLDTPGGKEETLERRLDNPAILHSAGVEVALITDDPVQDSRLFMRSGGLAIRGGLPPDVALQAMTLTPARLMHIDDEVGSLEVGKNADFVLLTDTPFSTWSLVQETWIEGNMVFDRADPAQALYATGGDLSSRGLR